MRVASLRPSRISLRSSGRRLLRTSAGELEMRQDRRGNRQQCRSYPDRPQEKDGNCALPARAARNPEQCREAAEQADQSKPGTEPNASHAPAPTGKPWHDGKAEGQDNQELHQNVEHGSSPDGLLDSPHAIQAATACSLLGRPHAAEGSGRGESRASRGVGQNNRREPTHPVKRRTSRYSTLPKFGFVVQATHPGPSQGADRDRHEPRAGVRWTRRRRARMALQGGTP